MSSRSRNRIRMRARRSAGAAAHAGNAAAAALHRGVDVCRIGVRHMADHFAGRRIGHLAVTRRRRRDRASRRSTAAAVQVSSGPCRLLFCSRGGRCRRCGPSFSARSPATARRSARAGPTSRFTLRADGEVAQRRCGKCMRDQVHGKAAGPDLVDRQARRRRAAIEPFAAIIGASESPARRRPDASCRRRHPPPPRTRRPFRCRRRGH